MNIPPTKQGVSEDGHGPVKNRKASPKAGLSVLVEQVLKISNEFIQGFKAVMEFKILASNQNNYDETFSNV